MKPTRSFTRPTLAALLAALFTAPAAMGGTMIHLGLNGNHRYIGNTEDSVGMLRIDGAGTCSATVLEGYYTGTSTFIANDWVLTAAHCVDTATELQFFVDGEVRDAAAWYVPDTWTGDLAAGNDIALIKLANPLDNTQGKWMYREGTELGQTIKAVGYGRSGTGYMGETSDAGVKRGGYNKVTWYADEGQRIIEYDFDVDPRDFSKAGITSGDLPPEYRAGDIDPEEDYRIPFEYQIAPGDSGGPDFLGDQIAGVHSYYFGRLDGATDATFTDFSGSTRVAAWADWVDSVINAVDILADPTGGAGVGGEGVANAVDGGPSILIATEAQATYVSSATQYALDNGVIGPIDQDWGFFLGTADLINEDLLLNQPDLPVLFHGDANQDGVVDLADLQILATNFNAKWGDPGVFAEQVEWTGGNFNFDLEVDNVDLALLLLQNWLTTVEGASIEGPSIDAALASVGFTPVPEPGSLMLLGAGMSLLTIRRR